MTSHRMIPPTFAPISSVSSRRRVLSQILTKMLRTFLAVKSSSKAFFTASAVAPPPTSSYVTDHQSGERVKGEAGTYEVGGLPAVEVEYVHRGHCQTSAIH